MVRYYLLAISVLALLLVGCETDSLGTEYREISEEESNLQFYAPGLEGGYRKILHGQDDQFVTRTAAVYGPKQGEYPHGQLVLVDLPPGRHFTRVDPPQEDIKDWGTFKDRKIRIGPRGTAVNAIGRIDYASFQADSVSCVIFKQVFGAIRDSGFGTRQLAGYYCRGEAPMMTEGEAVAIAGVVGHRKFGAVEPPDGWDDVGRGAEHAKKARTRAQARDFDGAIREYDEAIRLDPANADYYRRRGNAYSNKGDFDRALGDYAEAIRIDPEHVPAYNSRGLTLLEEREYGRALKDFSDAIRIDPESAPSFNNRCWAYGLMRRPEEALRDCNESLRLKPDVPATLDSRALAYWLIGDHDKARQDLDRAREIDSRFAPPQDRFREFENMF